MIKLIKMCLHVVILRITLIMLLFTILLAEGHLGATESQLQVNAMDFAEGAILKTSHFAVDAGPIESVSWFIGDQPIGDSRCDDFKQPSQWNICLKVTRYHHGKNLTAVVKSQEQTVNITRTIHVKYVDLILNAGSYNVGDKLSARCVVRNSQNATVVWYLDEDLVKNATKPTMTFDKAFNKIDVRFLGILKEDDNGKSLICVAEIDGLKPVVKRAEILNVKYPPDSVQLTLNSVEGYFEGDLMTASCLVKSNPPGNVSCHLGEDVLPLEEETVEDGTVVARLKKELTKEDDEKVLRCVAEYNHIPVSSEKRIFVDKRYETESLYLMWLLIALAVTFVVTVVGFCVVLGPKCFPTSCSCSKKAGSLAHNEYSELRASAMINSRDVCRLCYSSLAQRPLPSTPTERYFHYDEGRSLVYCPTTIENQPPSYPPPRCNVNDEDDGYLKPKAATPHLYLSMLPDLEQRAPEVPLRIQNQIADTHFYQAITK